MTVDVLKSPFTCLLPSVSMYCRELSLSSISVPPLTEPSKRMSGLISSV